MQRKRMRGESAKQVAIDACYHRACDRLANVDLEMLERMADATARAVFRLTTAL
jgi:hypothetical protein